MKNIKEIKEHLDKKYQFRYNEVSTRVEFSLTNQEKFKPLNNRKLKSFFIDLNSNKMNVSISNLECLLSSDFSKDYNPFEIFFENLPIITGTSNIEALAETIKTHDNDFFIWAFTKWLVAMVGNMINENITNHACIILSGNQGIGKSTWVRNLLPQPLKDYYYEGNVKIGSNDSLNYISSKCLINLDELAGMTFNKAKELKELITKSNIELRKAYAQLSEAFMRRASFIGSVNGTSFLFDLTGNRRFLSFEVLEFENSGNHNVDMNLVFAEAYQLYKNGFQYWFDSEEQERIEKNNEQFIVYSADEVNFLKKFATVPLKEHDIKLYLDYYFIKQYAQEPQWKYEARKQEIQDQINELAEPKYLTIPEIYFELHRKDPSQYDSIRYGKILAKHKFEKKRTNTCTKYKVYDIAPNITLATDII